MLLGAFLLSRTMVLALRPEQQEAQKLEVGYCSVYIRVRRFLQAQTGDAVLAVPVSAPAGARACAAWLGEWLQQNSSVQKPLE